MTDLEWLKYVEKLSRKIRVPGDFVIETTPITGTYGWKTTSIQHQIRNKKQRRTPYYRKKKPVKAPPDVPKLNYVLKTYVYKGKKYTRKFIDGL